MTAFTFVELAPGESGKHLVADGTTVGREGCDLILTDPEASRRHAAFRVIGTEIAVEDLGSSNGTFVNGRRIEAPTTLALGDEIRIGATVWRLEQAPAPETVIREREADTPAREAAAAPAPSAPASRPRAGDSRGVVPAPPDPSASAVHAAPAADPAVAPAFERVPRERRRPGSAARSRAATAIAFAVVLATAIALAVYFGARDGAADEGGGENGTLTPAADARGTR